MAHTTFSTQNGAECKIYFNYRETGPNTLATNYFGGYNFYHIEDDTKRTIRQLIFRSIHVEGRDVYANADLSNYRYNGTERTDDQRSANDSLKALLEELSRTTTCYDEQTARRRFGTSNEDANEDDVVQTTTSASASANTTAQSQRVETYTMEQTVTHATPRAWMSVDEILRHIRSRGSYHCNMNGSARSIVATGLEKIPAINGVKTSIACELEMGAMDEGMQRQFAQLLHDENVVVQFENDSTVAGGEYPTEPLEMEKFIDFIQKWQAHIAATNNDMSGSGAHITIGKSDARANLQDLKIRLSRYAILLYSITSSVERQQLFGRDFATYATRITEVASRQVGHGMVFSCDSRVKAFEFRLSNYKMDVKATVRILNEIASVVFYHKPTANDFARFVLLVGEETARLRNEQGDPV